MMLSEKMVQLLNEQVNAELYSAYLYLSMSNYMDKIGLKGFSTWFFVQYKEETDHALYIYKYLQNEGADIVLSAVDAPKADFTSVGEVLDLTLGHERKVTAMINRMAKVAQEEADFRTGQFLLWYISEQAEEETTAQDIIDKVKLAGDAGMYHVDQEMGARVYTPSANPPVTL